MGWRIYRRKRIAPGVWFNLAKKGASLTVGGRHGRVTVGRRGVRESVNPLPGSGLSWWRFWGWPGKKQETKGDKA